MGRKAPCFNILLAQASTVGLLERYGPRLCILPDGSLTILTLT